MTKKLFFTNLLVCLNVQHKVNILKLLFCNIFFFFEKQEKNCKNLNLAI